jgi:hypothetical protein
VPLCVWCVCVCVREVYSTAAAAAAATTHRSHGVLLLLLYWGCVTATCRSLCLCHWRHMCTHTIYGPKSPPPTLVLGRCVAWKTNWKRLYQYAMCNIVVWIPTTHCKNAGMSGWNRVCVCVCAPLPPSPPSLGGLEVCVCVRARARA